MKLSDSRPSESPLAAGSHGIFMPLPRRKNFRAEGAIVDAPLPATLQPKRKPTNAEIVARSWLYGTFMLRFMGGSALDRLRGRGTIQQKAVRLRLMVQRLGPTSIKIGQQLGTRTDILRREYCDELNRLLDQVDPIPREETVKILETEWQRPLSEVFSAFDLEPIGSGSIASVYQAHLVDGTKVAVKVRRPNIDRILKADFVVLRSLMRWLERFGVIRMGRSRPVLDELEHMLGDELDFVLESRQTAMFRREARDVKNVTAPRVFAALCTPHVLVTEFVSGVSMNEIINAVQKRDQALLAELEAMGYNLRLISKRLLRLSFWQTFEAAIFHADLHPANIFVTPENTFVMIDFGCCGTLSDRYRHALLGFMRCMGVGDVASAANFMIMLNEPLPPIDLERYRFEMERVVRKFLIMNRSKTASWHEKCWGGAMKDFVELAQKFNIPVKAELMRYSRANSHLDFMVYRLHPEADPRKEFFKYYAERAQRSRRKLRKDLAHQASVFLDAASVGLGDLGHTWFQIFSRLRTMIDNPGFGFGSVINKLPFAMSVMIRFAMNMVFLLFLAVVIRIFIRTQVGEEVVDHLEEVSHVAQHPVFLLVGLALLFVALRKILVRTMEPEID